MRAPSLLLLVVVLIAACTGGQDATPDAADDDANADALDGTELLDALDDGGLVLYLRHTATTEGGVDDFDTLGDCDAQRELSEAGRQDAVEIGAAFGALQVPVDRVLASPFCRTVETAELAFDDVTTDEGLLSLATMELEGQAAYDRVRDAGRDLISSEVAAGRNLVLVGQVSNIEQIAGVSMDEGATAVFRPDGNGGADQIAQIPPQGWQRLADEFADR